MIFPIQFRFNCVLSFRRITKPKKKTFYIECFINFFLTKFCFWTLIYIRQGTQRRAQFLICGHKNENKICFVFFCNFDVFT